MTNVGELLREADPLRYEPMASPERRDLQRAAVLAAASGTAVTPPLRARIAVFATVSALLIVASFIGARMWSPFVADVHAAVRFEVRLAEDKPGPGLHEAKVPGSDRSVYLHNEAIVSNSDISAAHVVESNGFYSVSVEFNAAGAQKMRAATQDHVGRLVAILLDGQVAMAPVIRSPIGSSAMITGQFTKTRAEKIVSGITTQ